MSWRGKTKIPRCVTFHVHKHICIVYALISYFEGLRGWAQRSCKWKKVGLQTTFALVTDMHPSGCSVKWTVIDCTDLGMCMQQAVNVSITAGKECRKDHCENKLLVLTKKEVNFALNWVYNSSGIRDDMINFWNLKLPGFQLSRLQELIWWKRAGHLSYLYSEGLHSILSKAAYKKEF